MAAANPSVLSYRRALAEDLLDLARVLKRLQRESEVLMTYRRASEVAEALHAEEPKSSYTACLLTQSLSDQGRHLAEVDRVGEAPPLARRAVQLLEPFVRDQPDAIFVVSTLARARREQGGVELAAGESGEALKAWKRASELSRSLAERYPVERYNQACSLALVASVAPPEQRESLAVDAIATLRLAFKAGYRNLENLKQDADFEAIREREDFQQLLSELEVTFGAGQEVLPEQGN